VRTSEHVIERLSEHPDVLYVEQNGVARALQGCTAPPETPPAGLWGLSRVSYPNIQAPLRGVRYNTGVGADVYIMDTGIHYTHNDFQGRAEFGFDATGEGQGDQNGHGTHCAGTSAGFQYGISKRARLVDVKVLGRGGGGSWAGVVQGLDWTAGRSGNRVGSMSLGGGINQAANDAVDRLAAQASAIVSIASGNNNGNACNTSPASARLGITVNSIANNDARSGFSNFGTCSHIFAPGQNVLSAWIGSNTATNTISGTSMACPHVTGVVSDMWGARGGTAQVIRQRVLDIAVRDRVTNPGAGSPNLIAQTECSTSE